MSILSYNGGAVVAMKGKNCVAVASDKIFSVERKLISVDCPKIFELGPHLYVGLPGLATDTQTVLARLKFRQNLFELKEGTKMSPKLFSSMVSSMLYEKRFGPYFVEPLIAGLDPETYEPYICNMDLLGCINCTDDFVVGGTCSAQLFGTCETMWEPDLSPDDLFETISQSLMSAFNRDAGSGWGAVVHIIEKDKVTTRHLKTRMD